MSDVATLKIKQGFTGGVFERVDFLGESVDVRDTILETVSESIDDANVSEMIVGGGIDLTIDGASTFRLSIHDKFEKLLQSGVLSDSRGELRKIDVQTAGGEFRLVKVNKSAFDLELTFEELLIAELRSIRGPLKIKRGKMNRLQFINWLVKRAGGTTYAPDLYRKVKLVTAQDREDARDRDSKRKSGFAPGVKLAGKETKKLSRQQLANCARMLSVCDELKVSERVYLAAICTGIVEAPDFKNPKVATDGTSIGMFQATDIHGSIAHRRDIEAMTNKFLKKGFWIYGGAIEIARKNPKMKPGEIAQLCQGSAHPDRYGKYEKEARAILKAWKSSSKSTAVKFDKGEFRVDKGENAWDAITRLAGDINYRVFVVNGILYLISETDLFNSRPILVVNDSTPGVSNTDWDWDIGKKVSTAKISCRMKAWSAPPGSVVILDEAGPASGRWIVASISRDLFSPDSEIVLKKPSLPTVVREGNTKVRGDAKSKAEKVLKAARAIHDKHYPYVWGGGHGSAGKPSGGGYDCSGGVAAALAAAGLIPSGWKSGVPASGEMAKTWGEPGVGKNLTMYANPEHVFLVVKVGGKSYHLGTGDWGKGWRGFGVNKRMHPTAGFTARHWPGV